MTRHSVRCLIPTTGGMVLSGIREVPAQQPVGSLLFSHCFTCNKDLKAIVKISRALAELGWSVLRYDFRGLGNSEGEFCDSSFTTNREDLHAASRYLAGQGLPVDILVGHSFGGAASMHEAGSIESVRGVVALAAPSDTHHLANLLEAMDPRIVSIGSGEVVIGGVRYRVNKSMPDDFRSYDLPAVVAGMNKPVLALHSRTDETVGYHHAIKNCGFTDGFHHVGSRSLITLPDCDHLINSDSICKLIAHYINAWSLSL